MPRARLPDAFGGWQRVGSRRQHLFAPSQLESRSHGSLQALHPATIVIYVGDGEYSHAQG